MSDISTASAPSITIEQLEALASQIEANDNDERERLLRLCRAMARILAARQPEVFRRYATSCTDEAGHFDNSFPPKAEYHYARGPRLIEICDNQTDDLPTSGGYYHTWRRETTDVGCFIGRDGSFFGCNETGTGRVGQFAAHPGDCDREIELDWHEIEPTLEDLRATETVLRAKMAEYLARGAA